VIRKTISFDLPDGWTKQFSNELNKIKGSDTPNGSPSDGCLVALLIFVIVLFIAKNL
jgi:hypothetical protein